MASGKMIAQIYISLKIFYIYLSLFFSFFFYSDLIRFAMAPLNIAVGFTIE